METYHKLPDEINEYINNWKFEKGSLIMILRKIQDYFGYIPKDISFFLAKELQLPLARIYEVLTFYNYFKLTPPGKNRIAVCTGTACYLKGAPQIIESIEKELEIKEGQTTPDGEFTLECVRCIGCCSIAPNIRINQKTYGNVDPKGIKELLDSVRKEG